MSSWRFASHHSCPRFSRECINDRSCDIISSTTIVLILELLQTDLLLNARKSFEIYALYMKLLYMSMVYTIFIFLGLPSWDVCIIIFGACDVNGSFNGHGCISVHCWLHMSHTCTYNLWSLSVAGFTIQLWWEVNVAWACGVTLWQTVKVISQEKWLSMNHELRFLSIQFYNSGVLKKNNFVKYRPAIFNQDTDIGRGRDSTSRNEWYWHIPRS